MSTPSCVVGLGDEASPSPTPSAPPHSAPLTHSASWECLSTLPTNGSPLRHVTHVRPRPPRRHRAAHFPPESVSRRRSDLSPFVNVSEQRSLQGGFLRCDTYFYSSSTFNLLFCPFKWNLEGKGSFTAVAMRKANFVSFKGLFSCDCSTVISELVLFTSFFMPVALSKNKFRKAAKCCTCL